MNPDILFFFPSIRKVSTSYRSQGPPPIGLGYLASVCEQEGYSSRVVDLNYEKSSSKHIRKIIEQHNPRFVGVSFVTEARFNAFQVFNIVKEVDPGIVTIAGGPHPSLTSDDTLKNVKSIDFIVRGEGETAFIELLDARMTERSAEGIQGVSFRKNGSVVHNERMEYINDLDALPFPKFQYLKRDNYNFFTEYDGYGRLKTVPLLSSRGCPFRCNFCATTKVWGANWRYRSSDNVMSEIDSRKNEYGIEAVWFVDDNFNSNPVRMLEICEKIREQHPELKWICNIRVDNLKEEHVKIMADSGCISVEFGAESGSQRILDEIIHKKIKIEKVVEVDDWCNKYGIITDAQFIISNPTETYEEARQTLDLIRRLKGKSTLQILKVYPGTDVENIAIENSVIPDDFSWARDQGSTNFMSTITGDAPLFVDKLTLGEISELMTEAWTDVKSFSLFYLIKKVLVKIRSPREFYNLGKLGVPVVWRRLLTSFRLSKRS